MANSRDLHLQRMRLLAGECLAAKGFHPVEVHEILRALGRASVEAGHCVCCGYKRKAATGAPTTEPDHLDGLRLVAANPQRDGDDGDTDRRLRHDQAVLFALWRWGPLTDEELSGRLGIYHNSCNAARAALMTAGWVEATGRKRLSQHGRPMTVWRLTSRAEHLFGGGGDLPPEQMALSL
jgi:hypothetical protein